MISGRQKKKSFGDAGISNKILVFHPVCAPSLRRYDVCRTSDLHPGAWSVLTARAWESEFNFWDFNQALLKTLVWTELQLNILNFVSPNQCFVTV